MKTLLSASVCLLSLNAFACPQLTGTWNCTTAQNNRSTLTISQKNVPHGVSYTVTDDSAKTLVFIADGASHSLNNGEVTGSMTATCPNANSIVGVESFADAKMGMAGRIDFSFNMSSARTLVSDMKSNLTMTGQPAQVANEKVACILE